VTEWSAGTDEQINQLSEDLVRQELLTVRPLAVSLNMLPAFPPISRLGTAARLEQNPCFQLLQQHFRDLINTREALAED